MAGEEFAMINESMPQVMSQMPTSMPAFFVPGMIFIVLLVFALSLLAFVAWIWMIVDCAKRNKFKNGDRVMWILLLVLTGPIGMLLYYFMEMRK